jgi:hypothetical protein
VTARLDALRDDGVDQGVRRRVGGVGVDDHVRADGAVGPSPRRRDSRGYLAGVSPGHRERPEAARFGHGDGEFGTRRTPDGCLYDRCVDAEASSEWRLEGGHGSPLAEQRQESSVSSVDPSSVGRERS